MSLPEARRVRRQDDVRRLPQRMIGRQRLLRKDVERRAAEVAAVQRVDQGVGVDDLRAADVDDDRAFRQLRNLRSRRSSRAFPASAARRSTSTWLCAQELVELILAVDPLDVADRSVGRAPAQRDHAHAERFGALRDLGSDRADADQPERASVAAATAAARP